MKRAIGRASLAVDQARRCRNGVCSGAFLHDRIPRANLTRPAVRGLWSRLFSANQKSKNNRTESFSGDQHQSLSMPARQGSSQKELDDERIQTFLNLPTGHFQASTWLEGEKLIQHAIEEEEDFSLAFRLLDKMAEEPDAKRRMNTATIHSVVYHWSNAFQKQQQGQTQQNRKSSKHIIAPAYVWQQVEIYHHNGIPLESRTFHRIIEATAHVKSRKAGGPEMAESILDYMMEVSKYQNPNLRPSTMTFNGVIESWEAAAGRAHSKSDLAKHIAPSRAMALLQRLKTLYMAGWSEEFRPDRNTFRGVMNLYAQQGDGDQVEALLQELYDMYLTYGTDTLYPKISFFVQVLYAWSKSNDPDSAERASTILDRMLEMEENQEIPGLRVTPFCFNLVMVCWSRKRTLEATEEVQRVFDRMVELSKSQPEKVPTAGSYSALIQAWRWWDAKKAEDVFWLWKREFHAGRCAMRIDNKHFSCLISAWFNSKAADSARRCDKLLQYGLDGNLGDSLEPTRTMFDLTIAAYCRENKLESTERAEALLQQMDTIHKSSKYDEFPGPNQGSYLQIVSSLRRLGHVERADDLLREWWLRKPTLYTETSDKNDNAKKKVESEIQAVRTLLSAWRSKASFLPHSADRAEDLLLTAEQKRVRLTLAGFQSVVDCREDVWKKETGGGRRRPTSPSRIKEVLDCLVREYERGHLGKDEETYPKLRQKMELMLVENR